MRGIPFRKDPCAEHWCLASTAFTRQTWAAASQPSVPGAQPTHHGRPAPELAPGLSPHLPYILFFKPNLRTRTPFLMKQDVRQNQVKAVSKVCAFSPSPATQHSTPLPRQLPFSEQQISSTDGHQSGKELWLHL